MGERDVEKPIKILIKSTNNTFLLSSLLISNHPCLRRGSSDASAWMIVWAPSISFSYAWGPITHQKTNKKP